MATTTAAPRKGPGSASAAVPPCSFSNRQRKLGPAPFASMESFESDLDDSSPPDPDIHKLHPMPQIKEDGIRSPDEEPGGGGGGAGGITQFGGVTVIPSGTATMSSSSAPTSGPTSGLQTPSTPRIDISCASSSTPPSEESNSERELFPGGLGLAFQEEMADDLRSSTEELEFGDEDIHDERRRREPEDPLRRASQPAIPRKASMTPTDDDYLHRKPSAHSLFLEGLLQRPCRHSSFGAADRIRPGALSSLSAGADGRRSASPHKMLLETSFCGNKPIPTPSIDLDSPPKPPLDEPRLLPMENSHSGMISSDSSFESHKPITLTTVQVHHHHHHHQQHQHPSTSGGGRTMTMTTSSSTGSTGAASSRDDSRKNVQKIETPDSPKSSDHWKPISPKPQNSSSNSNYTSPDNQNKFFNADFNSSSYSQSPLPARKNSNSNSNNSNTNSPITLTMSRKNSNGNKLINESPTSPPQPSQQQKCAPMTPGMSRRNMPPPPAAPQSDKSRVSNDSIQKHGSSSSSSTSGFNNNFSNNNNNNNNNATSTPNQISSTSSKIKKSSETTTTNTTNTATSSTSSAGKSSGKKVSSSNNSSSSTVSNSKKEMTKDAKAVAQKKESREALEVGGKSSGKSKEKDRKGKSSNSGSSSKQSSSSTFKPSSSSSKPIEHDEITTEMKITEDAMLPLQDSMPVETETKGFFLDSLEDEEDLPYVPTTLPLEKSVAIPIIPIKERRKFFVTTTPIQRPRARPPNPTTLNDFISSSTTTSQNNNCNSSTKSDTTTTQKMKINLPRDDSLPESNSSKEVRPKSPKKKLSTTWTDFAEMGLRSPREIRRRMREENGDTDVTYHSDSSQDTGVVVNETGGSDEETESLLKLPKVPFAMDLDVKSNRSSVISQEEAPPSPSNSAQLDQDDDQ